jgi:putative phosphoesterase
MRIGVVSDTHNNLANVATIVDVFNRAAVDRVVHTGDITQARTLEVFAGLHMPMCGVFGNNDLERVPLAAACQRHAFHFVDPPLHLRLGDRDVVVVHDPLDLPRGDHDLALHGHNHRTIVERDARRLTFNPGECAGHMTGHNCIGIVDLVDLSIHIERF